ncbi:M56 family metallopeptidase [Saccharomonospora azurea]|uniref:Zn-dependent protease with chaperone function n=1 Tax=Saccharomonospora azurea NA-128 TaxID=882081 RepID=H8G849_9PSEU|nr:M56 family metallopeptidase [Saccharomonospora azurea]EHK89194.1 Zn-dependent protease with chaperone function [Saccharomonospora azurea SZMC 14600]EHY89401.1 Zn-dependent protease with chaperone function [Saccharomonospora azurea NA-128]
MILVGHQVAAAAVAVTVMVWLLRSRWTHAHPRPALVLWQMGGLTLVLSTVGMLFGFGLAPFRRGVFPALLDLPARWTELDVWHLGAVAAGLLLGAWLVVNQILCFRDTARARARHRLLLQLVAQPNSGALVEVDHPVAVAYCVPGRHPRIVVSAGARRLLSKAELDAVLAHERAHARERHDLVLAPFQALRRLLPSSRLLTRVCSTIELLVEMCADDRAARQHGREPLARALERFHAHGAPGTPIGALAVAGADAHVVARIHRLRQPQRAAFPLVWPLACAMLVVALATSASIFALPLQ